MKKIIKMCVAILSLFIFTGCSISNENNTAISNLPRNNNLKISGDWKIERYRVLESGVLQESSIKEIESNKLIITPTSINISNNNIGKIRYKLKVVKPDYTISYENNFKMENLVSSSDSTETYSIIFQNNILGEFIYIDDEASYFYYQGVLFKVTLEDKIDKESKQENCELSKSEPMDTSNNKSQGVYIALKEPGKVSEYGKSTNESYRTLWINLKDGELQPIKEKQNIIFPRLKGIWELEPKLYRDDAKGIYYEYFMTKPIDDSKVSQKDTESLNISLLAEKTIIKRSINFVGNDYIATETFDNSGASNYSELQLLPIDNLGLRDGVSIRDLYPNEDISIQYDEAYENTYKNLTKSKKIELSKFVDYSNFTLQRNNGKWVITARIPSLDGKESVDYSTNIKPNKKLINYDTLLISWKVLKGINPFMIDAFTSPNGSLAIIVMKDELLLYKIGSNGLSDEPIKRIPLKEGEEIIMTEWCSGNYIDKWGSVFNENSKIID